MAALLAMHHGSYAQSAGRNLITNPGFEDGTQPWVLDNWMRNWVSADRDNQYPHSGQWSVKVQLLKVINGPTVSYAFPHLQTQPGSAIQIKFWARGVSNGANLTVMVRREIEPRISYLRTEMNLTDEWQQHTYTVQLPQDASPDANSLRFTLNQPGVFWIDDVSVVTLPPMDNGPAPVTNMIRNPSFEAGTDGWTATFRKREFGTLSQESGNGAPAPDDAKLETATAKDAPHGQRYLTFKIDPGCRNVLTSAYFPARYGHKGTLNFYLKADSVSDFEAGIGGGTNSGTAMQTQTTKTSTQWQKYSLPFTLRPAQDGLYFVTFKFSKAGRYAIDAVTFTEDDEQVKDLYPQSVAIQTSPDAPVGNLYGTKDAASFKLITANGKPGATISYQITVVDYLEHHIAAIPVNLILDEQGYGEQLFSAPVKDLGAFRIEARQQGKKDLLAEQLYSVLPPLPPPSDRPDSYFGGHVDFTPYNLEIARKGGFRWLRMWPPLVATWIAAEPRPGVWNFQTADVKRASAMGFQITGILGTTPDFKADIDPKNPVSNRWSHSYSPKSMNDWKQYVAKCISAFAPNVKTWEIWNEPDGGYLMVKPEQKKADVYISLLKAARQVIDSAGKPITLMGPALASINAPLGTEILEKDGGKYMDAFSFHFYSLAAGGSNPDDAFVLPVLDKYRTYKNNKGQTMPLWHTEGGMYLQGAQSWLSSYRIPVSSPASKPAAAAAMVRAALFFKAMGVKRYFDFELGATAAGHEMNNDLTTGFIEVTGIPGPGLAAHAAMVAITEDAEPAGFEDKTFKDAHLKIAHFRSTSGRINVYWSDQPISLKKLLKQPGKVLDMMGNAVDGATATIGEYPLYVISNQ